MEMDFQTIVQTKDGLCREEEKILLHPDAGEVEDEVINLYPEVTYETFEGFGGAVTEAAGYVYSLMDEQQKKRLMETYFSPEKMNYRMIRIPMDSCDFSLGQYEALSDPADIHLTEFSFERTEKYIIPMLVDAEKAAGKKLPLMLSPWSPPAFMKTNGRREQGGKLKAEYREMWAEYLCHYILEFQKRGFFVARMSLQNEPHAVQTWDSCVYTAEEEKIFLRDFMYPALKKHGLEEIEILLWDHNKERLYEWARDIIDDTTASMVGGMAFHWYSGDHFEALDLFREWYPGKKLIMSESCLEFRKFEKEKIRESALCLVHEIIGDLSHGMCALYDWNLLLDEKGGPNYVGNHCHAPFLFDTQKKELTEQDTAAFFDLFSHALTEGSRRIASTKYTDGLETAAYRRPDGTVLLFILNKTQKPLPVNIRLNKETAKITILPGAVSRLEFRQVCK